MPWTRWAPARWEAAAISDDDPELRVAARHQRRSLALSGGPVRNTNVTVAAGFIGASNREDVIDPEILRPGWLDVKIRIDRPDEQAARGLGVFWQSTSSATFRLIRAPYNQIITW